MTSNNDEGAVSLDDSFSLRLSKGTTKGQQGPWTRHEDDEFRLVWSRWVNNYIVMSLSDSDC